MARNHWTPKRMDPAILNLDGFNRFQVSTSNVGEMI